MTIRTYLNNYPAVFTRKLVFGTSQEIVVPADVSFDNVTLKADKNNSGTIYLGSRLLTAAPSADGDEGFALYAGDSIGDIRLTAGVLFAIASGSGQILWVYGELPSVQ